MTYDNNDDPVYSVLNGKPCTDDGDCAHICVYFAPDGFRGYKCSGRGTGDFPYCCPPQYNGLEFYQIYETAPCYGGVCEDIENPFPPA